jgi:hypothetical protein
MANPPKSVTMVTGNRWIAQKARQYAARNAIMLVVDRKRKACVDGTFLQSFYSVVVYGARAFLSESVPACKVRRLLARHHRTALLHAGI